jgi:hypothetical protein
MVRREPERRPQARRSGTRTRGIIAAVLVTAGLLSCGWLVGAAQGAAVAPFVIPGAADVTTDWSGLGTARVSYRFDGEPFGWRGVLSRQLERDGWSGHSYANVGARRPPFVTIWFTYETDIGPLLLNERAVFGTNPDDPNQAIVDIARELRLRSS